MLKRHWFHQWLRWLRNAWLRPRVLSPWSLYIMRPPHKSDRRGW